MAGALGAILNHEVNSVIGRGMFQELKQKARILGS